MDGSESLVDAPPLDPVAVQVPSAQVLAKALLAVAAPAMAAKAGVCARMMLAAHHRCVVPGHQKDSVWKVPTPSAPASASWLRDLMPGHVGSAGPEQGDIGEEGGDGESDGCGCRHRGQGRVGQ